jgi:hypothetical protein
VRFFGFTLKLMLDNLLPSFMQGRTGSRLLALVPNLPLRGLKLCKYDPTSHSHRGLRTLVIFVTCNGVVAQAALSEHGRGLLGQGPFAFQ